MKRRIIILFALAALSFQLSSCYVEDRGRGRNMGYYNHGFDTDHGNYYRSHHRHHH